MKEGENVTRWHLRTSRQRQSNSQVGERQSPNMSARGVLMLLRLVWLRWRWWWLVFMLLLSDAVQTIALIPAIMHQTTCQADEPSFCVAASRACLCVVWYGMAWCIGLEQKRDTAFRNDKWHSNRNVNNNVVNARMNEILACDRTETV